MPSDESEALTLPEDVPLRMHAAEIFSRGETIDITYRIRVGGRIKHLRAVADAVRDVNGRPVRVYGIIQDVTARETSLAKLAEVEQQLREHQRSLAAEHRLAMELQHIVLPIPKTPVDLPGLRVAVRYLPAEQAERVGGDWFHAAVAGDGSVVLAVGDVAGHGVHAAASMARLRHAFAALTVTTTSDPAELLTYLNRLLYAGGTETGTASAVVARHDPRTGAMVWAQAGHPPPLRTRAGATTELDRPAGPLLGALPDAGYATAATTIRPGALLLFYTDGLVEHRDHTLSESLKPVVATLNRISAEGHRQPLADLLAQLDHANPHDDTCVLAARPLPFGGESDE
jgi:serine phosphatase RsbU (regulator of sigma subunit)